MLSVVIGSNRGIGLEFCRQLSERGDHVIAVCRKKSPELEKLNAEIFDEFDATDEDSLSRLSEKFRSSGEKIDLLVHNAGIMRNETLEDFNLETIREQFEVNALAPLRVVISLLDYLKPGSKVGLMTSRMGSISDNSSGGRYGYRISKAALNAGAMSLARDLCAREISVGILHPGYVRTDMTQQNGLIDPPESVRGLLDRIDQLSLETTGTFWHTNGEVLPW